MVRSRVCMVCYIGCGLIVGGFYLLFRCIGSREGVWGFRISGSAVMLEHYEG